MRSAEFGRSHCLNVRSQCLRSLLNKLLLLVSIFFLLSLPKLHGQQVMDYTIQANIIYRFTKYIDWPESKKTGDFVIGVIGDSPLTDELKSFVINKTAGTQKIVVKKFSPSAETYNCQILFISDEESGSLKKIAMRTSGNPILIVTELEGLAQSGACVNFITVSDHLKLEINKNNIEHRSLGIASELLQLGIIVK